jgi:hypothetical protein
MDCNTCRSTLATTHLPEQTPFLPYSETKRSTCKHGFAGAEITRTHATCHSLPQGLKQSLVALHQSPQCAQYPSHRQPACVGRLLLTSHPNHLSAFSKGIKTRTATHFPPHPTDPDSNTPSTRICCADVDHITSTSPFRLFKWDHTKNSNTRPTTPPR